MPRFVIMLLVIFLALNTHAQSFDCRQVRHENKWYLVCEDYLYWGDSAGTYPSKSRYFALDMATAKNTTQDLAIKLWEKSNQKNPLFTPKFTVTTDKKKEPQAIDARKIKGFDDMLDKEDDLLKKRKKEDKENYKKTKIGIFADYQNPAAIRYDTTNHRIFLMGSSGISYVYEDSLNSSAKQVLGQVPGLRLHSVVSPDYHRYIFLIYTRAESGDTRYETTISRVFDTHTMQLLQLPEFGTAKNPAFTFCPTGNYVLVHGKDLNFGFTPGLVNLKEWKYEGNAHFPILNNDLKFFLYSNLVYVYMKGSWVRWKGEESWLSYLSVIAPSQNSKEIFRYNKKK
jgi:hypothetical protein